MKDAIKDEHDSRMIVDAEDSHPLVNVSGDVERIIDDMWKQLRNALPHLDENVCIGITSWEHRKGDRATTFSVWDGNKHLLLPSSSNDIPIKDWNELIAAQQKESILFRKF